MNATSYGGSPPGGTLLFAFMGRRRFLKATLIGAGGVVAAGAAGMGLLRGWPDQPAGFQMLDRWQAHTALAIADTVLPRGGPIEQGAADFQLARRFDAYLRGEPSQGQRNFEAALYLVEFAPVVFGHTPHTFAHLDPGTRTEFWKEWGEGPHLVLRQATLAFQKFFFLLYFDQPEVWPAIGYPGPSLKRLGRHE